MHSDERKIYMCILVLDFDCRDTSQKESLEYVIKMLVSSSTMQVCATGRLLCILGVVVLIEKSK